jgi:hypothetical protein
MKSALGEDVKLVYELRTKNQVAWAVFNDLQHQLFGRRSIFELQPVVFLCLGIVSVGVGVRCLEVVYINPEPAWDPGPA